VEVDRRIDDPSAGLRLLLGPALELVPSRHCTTVYSES
jgi:hypothetical protein